MLIKSNANELYLQLVKYKEEVERKLTAAVIRFSYHAVLISANNTPLGDEERYQKWYARRYKETGLRPEEGLAQGGWQANTSGTFGFRQEYGVSSGQRAADDAENNLFSSYKLGQTVWIGNTGPYILELEDNHSPQTQGMGIREPSIKELIGVYSSNFKYMYDNA